MPIDRRSLLARGAVLPLIGLQTRLAHAAEQATPENADYTLRIATARLAMSEKYQWGASGSYYDASEFPSASEIGAKAR